MELYCRFTIHMKTTAEYEAMEKIIRIIEGGKDGLEPYGVFDPEKLTYFVDFVWGGVDYDDVVSYMNQINAALAFLAEDGDDQVKKDFFHNLTYKVTGLSDNDYDMFKFEIERIHGKTTVRMTGDYNGLHLANESGCIRTYAQFLESVEDYHGHTDITEETFLELRDKNIWVDVEVDGLVYYDQPLPFRYEHMIEDHIFPGTTYTEEEFKKLFK